MEIRLSVQEGTYNISLFCNETKIKSYTKIPQEQIQTILNDLRDLMKS
jgi:hypothetical protein